MLLLTGSREKEVDTNPTITNTRNGNSLNSTMTSSDNQDSVSARSDLYFETYNPPFLPLLILAFPIMPLFRLYHVRLTKQELSFGYNFGIVSRTVDRSIIQSAEPLEHINGLLQWGGWGIRKNLSWQTGYISKNGSGVKLTLNERGKEFVYVFNCEDPEKLCDLLVAPKK